LGLISRPCKTVLPGILAAFLLALNATPARSQDIVGDALAWFPAHTISLEYSNPATLRALPNYQSLRDRYMGRDLQRLEGSLAKLGIHESDIQELVLGWQAGAGKGFQSEGLATGALDPEAIAQNAASSGVSASMVEGNKAYCFAGNAGSTCVAVIAGSIGLFGPLPALRSMLKARAGQAPSASSDPEFTRLVDSAKSDAPIWGVALGQAVSKWFQVWAPGQKDLKMNWASSFRDVQSLSYQVEAGSNVDLSVKLDCTNAQAASSLRQLMEGLKLIQQMAWRSTNPSQPNPLQTLEIEAANNQVSFKLTADYAALERVGPFGRP
jgi:hypothetical protein